jgi:hypothetical protein
MTYEQVRTAVQELHQTGLVPSRKRIRAYLGFGSYQDIAPLADRAFAELGIPKPPHVSLRRNGQRFTRHLEGPDAVDALIADLDAAVKWLESASEVSQASRRWVEAQYLARSPFRYPPGSAYERLAINTMYAQRFHGSADPGGVLYTLQKLRHDWQQVRNGYA